MLQQQTQQFSYQSPPVLEELPGGWKEKGSEMEASQPAFQIFGLGTMLIYKYYNLGRQSRRRDGGGGGSNLHLDW